MRSLGVALVATVLFAATAGAAFAADPSVDDLINKLKATPSQLRGSTRGIRPPTIADDDAPVTASHASYVHRMSQPIPIETANDGALHSSPMAVAFVTGSAGLTPSAERTLDVLGKALTSAALGSDHFRIEGHTDTVGDSAANEDLSGRRARAVVAYLEQKFGIDAARLQAVGLGSAQLLVPTPGNTPEPRNRQVKIVNLNG